jgi:hypothetical protein
MKKLTTEDTKNTERETLTTIYRWIERNHPDGFVDSLTFSQNLERVGDRWYDRLHRLERERDEARHKLELCMAANSDVARIAKERDEAREQNAKLREALLRVRTWGLASKNWSATHGDDMAQWIDAGCVGELPPPRSEWICGKLEGAK